MTLARPRPLSPHLSIWKWGPHMAVSIAHRVAGGALATVGALVFVWWLVALASGPESYAIFHDWIVKAPEGATAPHVGNVLAKLTAIGLTLSFFTHMANGVRHFVLDTGAGYELKRNRMSALFVFAVGVGLTLAMWAYILVGKA